MFNAFTSVLFYACLLMTTISLSQDSPEPTPLHKRLKQCEGEWNTHSKATFGSEEPFECEGTMSSKSLGVFWIVNNLKGGLAGTSIAAIQTIGHDTQVKKLVGTWADSMIPFLWKYDDIVDQSGKKLTLEADGSNMTDSGKMTKYRDAYEFKTPDHIVATSSMQIENGDWVTFMTGDFTRKK